MKDWASVEYPTFKIEVARIYRLFTSFFIRLTWVWKRQIWSHMRDDLVATRNTDNSMRQHRRDGTNHCQGELRGPDRFPIALRLLNNKHSPNIPICTRRTQNVLTVRSAVGGLLTERWAIKTDVSLGRKLDWSCWVVKAHWATTGSKVFSVVFTTSGEESPRHNNTRSSHWRQKQKTLFPLQNYFHIADWIQ